MVPQTICLSLKHHSTQIYSILTGIMLLQFKVSDCSRKNNVYVYVLNFLSSTCENINKHNNTNKITGFTVETIDVEWSDLFWTALLKI